MMMAMKRFFGLFAVAAAAVAISACTNEKENMTPSAPEAELVQVKFTASPDAEAVETRTTLNGKKVMWVAGDQVSLFSGESFTHTSLEATKMASDGSWANFEGLAVEGSDSYVAVYPYAQTNAYADGVLTIAIPQEQTAVAEGFDPAANVSVAYSSDQNLVFRNVGALVGISLSENDAPIVTKITIKAKKSEGYYGLAGVSSLVLGEDNLPLAGEGSADSVTLLPPADGFQSGVTYYAVVYAGDYAGMEVIYNTDIYMTTSGEPFDIMRENPKACELDRNEILNIGEIPNACDILPDSFNYYLAFEKNTYPFVETLYETQDVTNGDVYTHISKKYDTDHSGTAEESYKFKGVTFYPHLKVVLCKGPASNGDISLNGNNKRLYVDNGAWLQIPVIPNRYLTGIAVSITSTGEKKWKVVDDNNEDVIKFTAPASGTGREYFTTTMGTSYKLVSENNNSAVSRIRIMYSKTPYVPEETIDAN